MRQEPAEKGPEPAWEGNSGAVRDGGWWRWDFLLCLLVAMVAAFLLPLDDADLPMHLRTGAWILDNGRVPFVEPFAWTRAGAPFYAYSWLPEVLYEWAWRAGGAMGLSGVHALLLGAVVVALWDLARVAQWSVWATRLILSVHLVLWLLVQPATRPQLMLAIALPMAWAGAYRLERTTSLRDCTAVFVLLFAANAAAVNSHLFFFLTLAPVVVLLAAPVVSWRHMGAFMGITVSGWMLSPYTTHLGEMLALNFGRNALQGSASPIMEMEGGFAYLMHAALGARLLAGGMLLLPLLPFLSRRPWRERWWYGLAWLAGLCLFGIAMRGVLLWWMLALPLVAWALATIPLPSLLSTRRAVVACWCLGIIGLLAQAAKARDNASDAGPLPHPFAEVLEPAVRWLSCATESDSRSRRAVTAFDYGSYLTWRVPQLSWSIDGRVIFPDSAAIPEAGQFLRNGSPVAPPWHSAEVVLLTATHATLADIASHPDWQRVHLAVPDLASAVSLLVRREIAVRGGSCPLR